MRGEHQFSLRHFFQVEMAQSDAPEIFVYDREYDGSVGRPGWRHHGDHEIRSIPRRDLLFRMSFQRQIKTVTKVQAFPIL